MKDSWKLINFGKTPSWKSKANTSETKSLFYAALSVPHVHEGNVPAMLGMQDTPEK